MVTRLIIINVAVYILQGILGDSTQGRTFDHLLSLHPDGVFRYGMIWQLVTYSFLHAGFFHIFFNMYVLHMFGREVEAAWGSRKFLAFYLGGALFSGLCFAAVHYTLGDIIPAVGASGAIMAVMMVYTLWWPNRVLLFMFMFPMKMRTFAIFIVVIEAYSFLSGEGQVANMAHLGGLAFGYLVVKGTPMLRQLAAERRGTGPSQAERDQQRLDDILAKLHRKGMQSLSWRERGFLKKYGKR
jgi:membrane associated rhomboid family serine protease